MSVSECLVGWLGGGLFETDLYSSYSRYVSSLEHRKSWWIKSNGLKIHTVP